MATKHLEHWNLPQYVKDFFGPPLTFVRVKPGYYRIVGQDRSYGFKAANGYNARKEISRYVAAKLRSMGDIDYRRKEY